MKTSNQNLNQDFLKELISILLSDRGDHFSWLLINAISDRLPDNSYGEIVHLCQPIIGITNKYFGARFLLNNKNSDELKNLLNPKEKNVALLFSLFSESRHFCAHDLATIFDCQKAAALVLKETFEQQTPYIRGHNLVKDKFYLFYENLLSYMFSNGVPKKEGCFIISTAHNKILGEEIQAKTIESNISKLKKLKSKSYDLGTKMREASNLNAVASSSVIL